jgi:CheY-like chemotaxis protein
MGILAQPLRNFATRANLFPLECHCRDQILLERRLLNGLYAKREPPGETGKQKVLIVTDSADRANRLKAMIGSQEIEIESAKTQEEIERACDGAHDIAIVDLSPAQLRVALPILRASEGHAQAPVLVSINQIAGDPNVAGLLPQYRAMQPRGDGTVAATPYEIHV